MITNKWYIVCFARELGKQNPIRRKIVGEEVVVFRTTSGRIAVLEDRCCHRNVHLSLGSIKGEAIKCGYHGWEYGEDGKCRHIPSLQAGRAIPASACVRSYPVEVKHRIIWAFFGDPAQKDNTPIPPLHQLDNWPFIFNYHELNGNIALVAESLFDAQHINHVHSSSIGTMMGDLSNEDTDFHLETTTDSMKGWYYRSNGRNLFEKIYFGFSKRFKTYFGFWFPHTSMLDLRFPSQLHFPSRRMIIYEHFYEIEPGRCMMIQITTWKNIFRFNPWFARWFMARKSNHIVEEDIAFLESNKHWHDKAEVNDMMVPADELTFAFTKLWTNNLAYETERTHTEETPQLQDTAELG
jgi:phenylpropionate dioxygenase-like ring-hydroxylating dioxygenase large terminal subunit